MKSKLLADYIKANQLATYTPDFLIEDIQYAGECVTFKERDATGPYAENHRIPLLDILAWVHGSTEAVQATETYAPADLVVPPILAELRRRPCSLAELQAALVRLIELHNEQGKLMSAAIHRLQARSARTC